ncbi:acyl-CoA desaturase [Corallococcus terminator]
MTESLRLTPLRFAPFKREPWRGRLAPGEPHERRDGFLLTWYVALHLAAIAGLFVFRPSWGALTLCAASYVTRMFGISAGYHRYFSHRSFRTSRAFQFLLALLAMSSTQRGVLWWASQHRQHHRASDTPEDPHSPLQGGLLHAQAGWLFERANGPTRRELVRDFANHPELHWLDEHPFVPALLWVGVLALVGGASAVFWGYVLGTVLLLHALSLGNTLAHLWGPRRFDTRDNSRNNLLYAVLSLGEFHNNHHHRAGRACQGVAWWEVDVVYLVLRGLERLGLVWDLCGVRAPARPRPRHPRRTPSSRWARPA